MSTLFAGVPTIRAAIFDVIDDGRGQHEWVFDSLDESDEQTALRTEFVDTVVKRIERLQNPPHDGVKLQNLCSRHIREVLPTPDVPTCLACRAEWGNRQEDPRGWPLDDNKEPCGGPLISGKGCQVCDYKGDWAPHNKVEKTDEPTTL